MHKKTRDYYGQRASNRLSRRVNMVFPFIICLLSLIICGMIGRHIIYRKYYDTATQKVMQHSMVDARYLAQLEKISLADVLKIFMDAHIDFQRALINERNALMQLYDSNQSRQWLDTVLKLNLDMQKAVDRESDAFGVLAYRLSLSKPNSHTRKRSDAHVNSST